MIKFETIYEGTTFYGAELEFYVDDQDTPLQLNDVVMHIKRKKDVDVVLEYSTSNQKLVVVGNKIVIPEHIPSLSFGKYEFDFNLLFAGGYTETGVARGEWEILNPITHR